MSTQFIEFVCTLDACDRTDVANGVVKVYEITYAFSDANGEVHSQLFDMILAKNAKEARTIGKHLGGLWKYDQNGCNLNHIRVQRVK